MYLGQEIKQILPGNVAIGGANMGMVPLFSVQWCPSRAGIWAGYAPLDGQEVSQNLYPDAFAGISVGNVPTTSEATWQADPTARGAYVEESSPGFFRLPDLNGKSVGSLGAVFLRGDGTLSAGTDGVVQQDALKSHLHSFSSWNLSAFDPSGGPNAVGADAPASGSSGSNMTTNSSGGVETRPLNVTGCWVVKLFGAVTNVGSADVSQLASDYATLSSRIGSREGQIGYNQTWQDVTSSRSVGVTYTNTTQKPIEVSISLVGSPSSVASLHVGGVFIARILSQSSGTSGAIGGSAQAIVPPGETYLVSTSGTMTSIMWCELR